MNICKNSNSYYNKFKFFCSVYKNREEHLSKTVIKYFPDILENNDKTFRILDIGSNDGELLQKVINKLLIKTNNIAAVALEPDQEAYLQLKKRFETLIPHKDGYNVDCLDIDLQYFLSREDNHNDKFDLILCSHVFYHFHPSNWEYIFNKLGSKLRKSGKLIIVLDSRKSSVYQLKFKHNALFNHNRNLPFGGDYFAEDLLSFIKKAKLQYYCGSLKSYLYFNSNNLDHDICETLTFLFRYDLNRNQKARKYSLFFIKSTLPKYNDDFYKLKWFENIFLFNINFNNEKQ